MFALCVFETSALRFLFICIIWMDYFSINLHPCSSEERKPYTGMRVSKWEQNFNFEVEYSFKFLNTEKLHASPLRRLYS